MSGGLIREEIGEKLLMSVYVIAIVIASFKNYKLKY